MKKIMVSLAVAAACTASSFAGALSEYFSFVSDIVPNKLKISAFQEVGYDNNIHNAAKGNERGSLFTKTGLGLDLYREHRNYVIGVEGKVSFNYYALHSHDMNEFEWNVTPKVLGNFPILGSDNLMLKLGSRMKNERMDSANNTVTRRMNNTIGLIYDTNFNTRYGILADITWNQERYMEHKYKSHSNVKWNYTAAPYYRLTDKSKIGYRFTFTETKYENNESQDNSRSLNNSLFYDWRPVQKFSSTFEVGLQKVYMTGDSKDLDGSDSWTPTFDVRMNYQAYSNLSLRSDSKYGLEDSRSNRGQRNKFLQSIGADWKINPKLLLAQRIYYSRQNEKNHNASDTDEIGYETRATYKFTERFSGYAGLNLSNTYYKYHTKDSYYCYKCFAGVAFTY